MACEVPVVSSSVRGLPEVQVHGETGFIVEIGDISRMARYAIELLTNDPRHKLFMGSARKRALEFDINTIVIRYEEYYELCCMDSHGG